MQFFLVWWVFEWETSVYFWPLFVFFKTPLTLLTYSAVAGQLLWNKKRHLNHHNNHLPSKNIQQPMKNPWANIDCWWFIWDSFHRCRFWSNLDLDSEILLHFWSNLYLDFEILCNIWSNVEKPGSVLHAWP